MRILKKILGDGVLGVIRAVLAYIVIPAETIAAGIGELSTAIDIEHAVRTAGREEESDDVPVNGIGLDGGTTTADAGRTAALDAATMDTEPDAFIAHAMSASANDVTVHVSPDTDSDIAENTLGEPTPAVMDTPEDV